MADLELLNLSSNHYPERRVLSRVILLPNIPGQRYTIGSIYKDEDRKDEFIFWRYKDFVAPTHCHITVNELGQFWIANVPTETKENPSTFINLELVQGPRLLENGDTISLGFPLPVDQTSPQLLPVFRVQEVVSVANGISENLSEEPNQFPSSFPTAVSLVFAQILSYLNFTDLKNCRLVSQSWDEEASKILAKRGTVSFNFKDYVLNYRHFYANNSWSTKVFRYLHEVRKLKMWGLEITLPPTIPQYYFVTDEGEKYASQALRIAPGEPGKKMVDDLNKVLQTFRNTSNNRGFRLRLQTKILNSSEFLIVKDIFSTLANNLTELKLYLDVGFLPNQFPQFQFHSLRRLEHHISDETVEHIDYKKLNNTYPQWVQFIVSQISKKLEAFACNHYKIGDTYLKEFEKCGFKNITTLEFRNFDLKVISSLLVNSSYTRSLKILRLTKAKFSGYASGHEATFDQLLQIVSPTLKIFHLEIESSRGEEITFPMFKKLRELSVIYEYGVRICWMGGCINYARDFPKLEKLEVKPFLCHLGPLPDFDGHFYYGSFSPYSPYEWKTENDVLNSFFPKGKVGETVKYLCVMEAAESRIPTEEYEQYDVRLREIADMFPNVKQQKFVERRQQALELMVENECANRE